LVVIIASHVGKTGVDVGIIGVHVGKIGVHVVNASFGENLPHIVGIKKKRFPRYLYRRNPFPINILL